MRCTFARYIFFFFFFAGQRWTAATSAVVLGADEALQGFVSGRDHGRPRCSGESRLAGMVEKGVSGAQGNGIWKAKL